jgi:hypothetical protein
MAERLTNAAISLEACRAVLSQEGQHEAAVHLRGMDFLNADTARMARGILGSLSVYGPTANAAKEEALNALELASDEQPGEA